MYDLPLARNSKEKKESADIADRQTDTYTHKDIFLCSAEKISIYPSIALTYLTGGAEHTHTQRAQ